MDAAAPRTPEGVVPLRGFSYLLGCPMNWSYGLTTVPSRLDNLTRRTLKSLEAAGFPDPWIFLDGAGSYPIHLVSEYGRYKTTFRNPPVRTFGNWILSLWEIYLRNPQADRFAIFQDDIVACRNLRSYLEKCEWTPKTYQNLYTVPGNAHPRRGQIGWHPAVLPGKGALALVFDRDALWQVLRGVDISTRPLVVGREVNAFPRSWKGVDAAVVDSLTKVGYREMIHWPSLVQHTGMCDEKDAPKAGPDPVSVSANSRKAPSDCFLGEDADAGLLDRLPGGTAR